MTDRQLATKPRVHDPRHCNLGEGPLWHPTRGQLFWFDISRKALMSQSADGPLHWQFEDAVSAAGWVDGDHLLIASERALFRFNLTTGAQDIVATLEAENHMTRSNDGRADPWGGFWIGTMGKHAETGLGAIYRYYRGEVRKLFAGISIPNAISFPPSGDFAVFADTARQMVQKVALDPTTGWPSAEPERFIDFRPLGRNPDGAVFDAEGRFWCAEWGASRVSCYDGTGAALGHVAFPARHTSCPAFGGVDLRTLFVTSAQQGLGADVRLREPGNGRVFAAEVEATGQAEHQVIL